MIQEGGAYIFKASGLGSRRMDWVRFKNKKVNNTSYNMKADFCPQVFYT